MIYGELIKNNEDVEVWTPKYGNEKQLEYYLIGKSIVEWDKDKLVLDDGTIITIEMSENDCCASAGGEFKNVKLNAVITDVNLSGIEFSEEYDGEITNYKTVTFIHDRNKIAQADMYANNGNGGYYYSVASLVITEIHFAIVDA